MAHLLLTRSSNLQQEDNKWNGILSDIKKHIESNIVSIEMVFKT